MPHYGVIGEHLAHSFSASYFARKFEREGITDCHYKLYELPSVEQISQLGHLDGFNVTIPYKRSIIPLLDDLSAEARAIGAVNCVCRQNGRLVGYNTDAYGVDVTLQKLLGAESDIKALVLGTGGASQAVQYVLAQRAIEYSLVSRSPQTGNMTYEDVDEVVMREHRLLINTTPLGMYPATEGLPQLPYDSLSPASYLFDLVYNPPLTEFLRQGQMRGASVVNGQTMLEAQAERSWQIWRGNY